MGNMSMATQNASKKSGGKGTKAMPKGGKDDKSMMKGMPKKGGKY